MSRRNVLESRAEPRSILDRTLVYAADGLLITAVTDRYPERDKSRIRVRSEPGWRVTETATGHDAMMCSKRTAPTVPRRRSRW